MKGGTSNVVGTIPRAELFVDCHDDEDLDKTFIKYIEDESLVTIELNLFIPARDLLRQSVVDSTAETA